MTAKNFVTGALILVSLAAGYSACRLLNTHSTRHIQRQYVDLKDNHQIDPSRVKCPDNARVFLVIGQSNAANYGAQLSATGMLNFYQGQCYLGRDPLLGSSGNKGSVWSRMKTNGVLAPVAVGGSHMQEWAPGGRLFPRIQLALLQLRRANLPATAILVQQGESEGNSELNAALYEQNATGLLRYLRTTGADVYFATTSRCLGPPNREIREAQARARTATGSFEGPDMDKIPNDQKYDNCHLTGRGLNQVAKAWDAILAD